MNKKDAKKYGVPIYTQEQMDALVHAGCFLVGIGMLFAFSLGYVVAHFDLQKVLSIFSR